jgi:hypothetical protein
MRFPGPPEGGHYECVSPGRLKTATTNAFPRAA